MRWGLTGTAGQIQLSIRQYQRPSGEVVALLVIAPSKTDRERVIPMSAELFHVVAAVIRRPTRSWPTVPLATRFDPHDKETSFSLSSAAGDARPQPRPC